MNNSPNARGGFGRVWLDRGVAAARAGRKAEAREALFRALNDESQREMAWLWLAAVSDDPRQERAYLEKVLSLNPHNEHARKGIAYLEKAAHKDLPTSSAADEDAGEGTSGGLPQGATEAADEAEDGPDVSVSLDEAAAVVEKPADGTDTAPERAETVGTEIAKGGERPLVPTGTAVQPMDIEQVGDEPTGWTTDVPLVERPLPVPDPRPRQSSGWTGIPPSVPRDPVIRQPRGPVRRREHRPRQRWDMVVRTKGPTATIVDEAFKSHEMWAVLASTVGLILLAVILALFFALSLLSGS